MSKKKSQPQGMQICFITPEELGALVKALRDMTEAERLLNVQGGYEKNPLTGQQFDEAALRVLNAARKAFWHAITTPGPNVFVALAAPLMVPIEMIEPKPLFTKQGG